MSVLTFKMDGEPARVVNLAVERLLRRSFEFPFCFRATWPVFQEIEIDRHAAPGLIVQSTFGEDERAPSRGRQDP